jgi:hypothetical protein
MPVRNMVQKVLDVMVDLETCRRAISLKKGTSLQHYHNSPTSHAGTVVGGTGEMGPPLCRLFSPRIHSSPSSSFSQTSSLKLKLQVNGEFCRGRDVR